MDTLLVIDITERSHLKFKEHPFKSIEVDPLGAFSLVSYRVLHVEDNRAYIHANLEELGGSQLLNLYCNQLLGENLRLKPKYIVLEEKNFPRLSSFSYLMKTNGSSMF